MYNCSEACEGNVCARLCGNSSCLCSRRCAVTTRQAGSGCDVGALEFHLRTVLGHQSLGGVVGNHRPLLSFMTSDEFLYIKYGGRWCWCKLVLKVTLCILIQTSGFRSQWRLEWYYTVQNNFAIGQVSVSVPLLLEFNKKPLACTFQYRQFQNPHRLIDSSSACVKVLN